MTLKSFYLYLVLKTMTFMSRDHLCRALVSNNIDGPGRPFRYVVINGPPGPLIPGPFVSSDRPN